MKRLICLFALAMPVVLMAQVQFGYLNYSTVMQEMPEYAQAQQELSTLKNKYEAEATRGEEEFQKMVDGLMERVEKRVSKRKKSRKANDVLTSKNDDGGMDAGRNVDIHWLENLKKLKQEFHSGIWKSNR